MEGDPDGAREVLVRDRERITQPPAPFHVTPRGFAGPNLLAMILSRSLANIKPLNRQRLAAVIRRQRSTTPRAIDGRSTPRSIFKASPVSSRPTPTAAKTNCMTLRARRDRLRPHSVGPMPGGSFLNWRTSPPMRGATRMPRRSRRSRWRQSSASARCSLSGAASTDKTPKSGCGCVKNNASRSQRHWKHGCANSALGCQS